MVVFTASCFFFFSSRRRHTRLQGDWSSDVCSSDLILVRALGTQTPGVNSSDGTAELGKRLLRLFVAHKFEVAFEAAVIVAQIDLFNKIHDFLDRGVVSDPVADEPVGKFAPKCVIPLKDLIREFRQRFRLIFMM